MIVENHIGILMNKNKKVIAVIGAGNIGLRHVQALFLSVKPIELYVVDPSSASLEKIKASYEIIENKDKITITLLKNMKTLPAKVDLAIIATASHIRRKVTEELLEVCEVKNVILEKVLFQRLVDYEEMECILNKKNIPAWVNCPRRMYKIYELLKEMLAKAENMQIMVSGGKSWELACNAIHMIDLIGYLAGEENGKIQLNELEQKIYESKREGFVEIGGIIKGKLGRCSMFSITTDRNHELPLTVMINSEELKCVINETSKKVVIAQKEKNWMFEEIEGDFPYQSQLTQIAVWDILDTGGCQLPTFKVARYEHELLQKPLQEYFKNKGVEKGLCPIT